MAATSRRDFMNASLAAVGAATFAGGAMAAETKPPKLPTVTWGTFEISRLLVGHNPLKGLSYTSRDLDREMPGTTPRRATA